MRELASMDREEAVVLALDPSSASGS